MVQNSLPAPHLRATMDEDRVAYFNNAGQARLLAPEVIKRGTTAICNPAWDMHAKDDQPRIRALYAQLIDAQDRDISIMPSTAFAITLAAENIYREAMDRSGKILVIQDQFCSAVYPWQSICDRSGGRLSLHVVSYPEGQGNWTDSILRDINDDILAVCLPPLHWSNGQVIELSVIGEKCRRKNIRLIVDATQAVGAMPKSAFSVETVQPDLLACSVHKWLRGPPGASLVYIAPAVQALWDPLDQHGRSRLIDDSTWEVSKNEIAPNGYPSAFVNNASKFDGGGKPNPIILPMVRTSLEQIAILNPASLQESLKELMTPLIEWASERGFQLPTDENTFHLMGLTPANRSPEQLSAIASDLKERGVYVAVRCGGLRISPYLDNSPSDIQYLIECLDSLL